MYNVYCARFAYKKILLRCITDPKYICNVIELVYTFKGTFRIDENVQSDN